MTRQLVAFYASAYRQVSWGLEAAIGNPVKATTDR